MNGAVNSYIISTISRAPGTNSPASRILVGVTAEYLRLSAHQREHAAPAPRAACGAGACGVIHTRPSASAPVPISTAARRDVLDVRVGVRDVRTRRAPLPACRRGWAGRPGRRARSRSPRDRSSRSSAGWSPERRHARARRGPLAPCAARSSPLRRRAEGRVVSVIGPPRRRTCRGCRSRRSGRRPPSPRRAHRAAAPGKSSCHWW